MHRVVSATVAAAVMGVALTVASWTAAISQSRSSGDCSPAFSQSHVTGDVKIICGAGRRDLQAIANALSQMSRKNNLDRSQVDRLLALVNEIVALKPELNRIDRNAKEANANTRDILKRLQALAAGPPQGAHLLQQIEGWKPRPRPSVGVDPNSFVRRMPFIMGLNPTGRCVFFGVSPASTASAEYKNLVASGSSREDEGRYTEAVAFYQQATLLVPSDSVAFYNTGVAECAGRRYDKALAAFLRASELSPNNSKYRITVACLLSRLKRYREAAGLFHVAAQLAPDDSAVPDAEGEMLLKAGDPAAAIVAYSHAIEMDPLYYEAYVDRAEARLVLGSAAGAVADLSAAVNIMPDNSEIRTKLAHAYRVLAADPVKSRQTDYRFFAEEQEGIAATLDKARVARAVDYSWRCNGAVDSALGNPCYTDHYTFYFDREEDYLTPLAKDTIAKIWRDATNCIGLIIQLKAFADLGEDEGSDGMDLSDARGDRVSFALINSARIGSSIGHRPLGHTDLPIQGTRVPDKRNQVVEAITFCRMPPAH